MENSTYSHDVRTDRDVKSATADMASQLADKASAGIDTAMNKASSMANDAARQGREAQQQVEQVATNIKGALNKSVSDQPMTTLALTAAFGFVLGALWKS